MLGLLLAVIPCIMFILGIVNFIIGDNSQAIGFVGASIIIAIIGVIIYCFSNSNSLIKMLEQDIHIMLHIDGIEKNEEFLIINASCEKDNEKYNFSATYITPIDEIANDIIKKVNELGINEVKAWIDFKHINKFLIDIDGLINKLGLNGTLELSVYGAKKVNNK